MTETQTATVESSEQEPEVFDAAYVEKLRTENAERRAAAKAAEAKALKAQQRVNAIVVERAASSVLADANDLLLNNPDADIYDEAGEVDEEKVKAAAEALLESKPYLAARQFGGDIGAGPRGKDKQAFSFSNWLQQAAG